MTLQCLTEGLSKAGVPVFVADVKGDLSGLSQAGAHKPALVKRVAETGPSLYAPQSFPIVFWDLYGRKGYPIRTTVSDMGPLLLSCLLGLNDTQEGVVNVMFAVADDEHMLLLDLKDLRSLLTHVVENAKTLAIVRQCQQSICLCDYASVASSAARRWRQPVRSAGA